MKKFNFNAKLLCSLILSVFMLAIAGGVNTAWAVIPAVSSGANHSLTLRSDGTLWASGSNQTGQLGDGSGVNQSVQIQVGTGNWIKVSAGVSHSLGVKADGSLWAWGGNQFGQLGDGTIVNKTTPVRIGLANDWTAVSAGGFSSFALKADGTLWAWGQNSGGQLGNGDANPIPADHNSPVQVLNPGGSKYVAVSTSGEHTLALQADGSLWSWGFNQFGQLGNLAADLLAHSTPIQVNDLDFDWKSISAGGTHSIAVKSDGTLWSWGRNHVGQLGNGSSDALSHEIPLQVGTASDWIAVSAGELHTLALKRNGFISSWGQNLSGQLGDGTPTDKFTPTLISAPPELANIVALSAGGNHSHALLANGSFFAWGDNGSGQFGDGTVLSSLTPKVVGNDVTRWIKSEPGNTFTVALRSNGTLWAWGENSFGQLGDSTIAPINPFPTKVFGTTANWLTSAAGLSHTVAIQANGTLWVWGDNSSGQLGDPAIVTNAVPQIITSTVPPSAANNWTAVAAGDFHTLALKSDGTLWAWGDNTSGQLGLSIGNSSMPTPNQVTTTNLGNFDRNWVAIAAGGAHSLGLQSDGTLWAWGSNTSGQLGDPFIVSNNTPNQIVDLTSVIPGFNSSWVAIAAGLSHSLALQADGTAWAWGFNQFGQLGNNDVTPTPADHPAPVLVFNSGSAPYISIAAGDSFSVARKADGSLWSWGKNTAGQLGIGSTDAEPAPAHATPLRESTSANDWTVAGVGGQHSIALKAGGLLNGWGDNTFGQLGDGSTATKNNPTALLEPAISVPAALNFVTAAVTVGPFPSTPFTIANTGSSTLVVSSMTITGTDNTMFARVPGGTCSATFPFNLATGASCTATVTFTPTSAGLKTATLSVNSNAPVTPIATVSLSGTGVLPFSIAASVSVSSPLNSGTISPAGSVPVAPGANQTFVFIPNAGFRVLDVIVDDISRGASASYTFSAVQGNHTIAVIYIGTQTIAAISGAGGTISPIGSVTINQGDNKNFIITPDYGFAISDVVVVEMVENLDINGNGLGTFSPVTTHLGPVSSFTFFNVRAPGSIIAASFIATDIRTWNWRNPLPQGLTIRHAETDGNGNYAAVGEFGIIMTSTNGVDWTVRQSGTMNLNGVAYGNGKFVTVGNGGRILQSSTLAADGYATWNEQSSGTASPLNGVIFNGSVFVAVGNSQISENFPFVPRMTIITSPDGVTWTDHSPLLALNETLDLRDIAAGTGGKLAAVGSGGTIFTSADNGLNWTRIPDDLTGRGSNINSITFGNNTFIAVGDLAQVTRSTDNGVTWNPVHVPNSFADLKGVAYGTLSGPLNVFVAVGSDGQILTSANLGSNWSNRVSGLANNGAGAVLRTVVIGTVNTNVPHVLVAGQYGALLTSPDSIVWTNRLKSSTNATLTGVARGNSVFVAVGGEPATANGPATASIVSSLDNGTTWSARDLPAGTQNLTAVAYGNGMFVAVGKSAYNVANPTEKASILSSPDGITWTSRTSGSFLGINSINFANGQFIAVGDYNPAGGALPEGAAILTSIDGITWTFAQIVTQNGTPLNGVTFGNNRYVVVGELGSLLTSPDGVVWTDQGADPVINGYDLTSVAFGNGTFRAVGLTLEVGVGPKAFVSSDLGATWTAELLSVPTTLNTKFRGIAYFNNQFIAVGNDDFIISKDVSVGGTKWVINTGAEFINSSLFGIAVGNGSFVAVGMNGTILQSTQQLANLPQINVSPVSLSFASVLVGLTPSQTISITNKGTTNLVLGSLSIPAGAFSRKNDACSTVSLAPNAVCTVQVTFAPQAAGAVVSSLTIPSNDPDSPVMTVPLAGTGVASVTLTLTVAGASTGNVTASPAGTPALSCSNGVCTTLYQSGATVTLNAVPNDARAPGVFSGACTGTGSCSVTMSANKNVTATFDIVNKVHVTVGAPLDHLNIQSAYNAASTGAEIKAQTFLFPEIMAFNQAKIITLSGGWDATYTVPSAAGSFTTIQGKLVVSNGKLSIKNIKIK